MRNFVSKLLARKSQVNWDKVLQNSAKKVDWKDCNQPRPTVNTHKELLKEKARQHAEQMCHLLDRLINSMFGM